MTALAGCSVLVTGAASGLGAAVARRLHARGAAVVLVDLDEQRGEALAASLTGPAARFVAADVTSGEDVQAAVAAATELAPLRAAVNCAGIVIGQKLVGRNGPHDLDAFARVIAVNLVGSFNVLRLAATAMAANEPGEDGERGVVVSTASIAAFDGQIGQIAYAASKAGVAGMTLPAARDLAAIGVRVCAVAPGTFETPMLAGLPQATRDELGRAVPFPSRLGRPDEFAALVEHVVDNPMLNGETIRLDGALRMPPR
ncbi:SDR family NAD(P)-dependent oxidoreductase [Conexibacter sp. JD483]|uniref:SDR family NAD(P)-dependent oxidoreductase n=1 Tax=unclassified Conexibacter TaxID=2627773 RepID=UPI002723BF89|nr:MULTISPECIES: SDR family NAD(P)-dependent oxidoreductase [unclassified Conexibacter]MDO8187684.1 SDR family NAD(P)-dependent oxidoreductase [Conexibacter sp. CPCC 205706]MDO8199869.1 SDR family NAD(P)-dependent oxidoreductase [Conexibacter sp. CPCC 205762]MDR9370246.1 SDR family NAD(P)-dependent oxidoreductase [Conexibacter sp. JD483]